MSFIGITGKISVGSSPIGSVSQEWDLSFAILIKSMNESDISYR